MAYGINSPVALSSFDDPTIPIGTPVPLSVDQAGYLRSREVADTILADSIVTGQRINQIEINFSVAFAATLITNTTANGGTASQANGQATYASGTNAAGSANGISVQTLAYRPGHEWYALFTAALTSGVASSHQRIGPYSTTDGFYVGYEGATLNITHRNASSDTHIPQSSWNGDPLDGSVTSKFTSGGSPEAINWGMLNIFRFRGAWFGTAPVVLDVFSPDGIWVNIHTFRFPNSIPTPYTATTNWNMQAEALNAGNTSNVAVSTACWSMGTTDPTLQMAMAVTDQTNAPLVRSVLTGKYSTASAYLNVGVDSSGNLNSDISGIGGNSIAIARPGVMLVGLDDATGNAIASINGALKVTEAGALHAYGQVLCTSTGVLILAANASRKSLTLSNPTGSVIVVYIGDVSVTAATGFALNPGQTVALNVVSDVYGITSSTSQAVSFIEVQ